MEAEHNIKKETWSEPNFIILDFKETKEGGEPDIPEDDFGDVTVIS